MATFQKSNWTRTASSEKARVYAPSALAAGNVTGNGGQTTVTVTVPFQFQGNGQIQASFPPSDTAPNNGLNMGEPLLLAPASGSYGAGNHPRIQVAFINSTNGNLNLQQTTDLIFVQY